MSTSIRYSALLALLGLMVVSTSACKSLQVLSLDGPSRVAINEPATFTAGLNKAKAASKTTYCWSFGDGTTEIGGTTATHSYSEPGTYTVSFTAPDCEGKSVQSTTIEVFDPCPTPAEIASISSTPSDPIFNESIRFSASVSAEPVATYSWDFGDGSTASTPTPSHSYADPGEYTVTLEVMNCGDQTDTRTLNLIVSEFRCSEVAELNSVFFDAGSTELTGEARTLLDENVAILSECAEINVRLMAYAAGNERRAMDLSNGRASTVQTYYTGNGIAASRITPQAVGVDPMSTGKEADQSRNRRVDTIILR